MMYEHYNDKFVYLKQLIDFLRSAENHNSHRVVKWKAKQFFYHHTYEPHEPSEQKIEGYEETEESSNT